MSDLVLTRAHLFCPVELAELIDQLLAAEVRPWLIFHGGGARGAARALGVQVIPMDAVADRLSQRAARTREAEEPRFPKIRDRPFYLLRAGYRRELSGLDRARAEAVFQHARESAFELATRLLAPAALARALTALWASPTGIDELRLRVAGTQVALLAAGHHLRASPELLAATSGPRPCLLDRDAARRLGRYVISSDATGPALSRLSGLGAELDLLEPSQLAPVGHPGLDGPLSLPLPAHARSLLARDIGQPIGSEHWQLSSFGLDRRHGRHTERCAAETGVRPLSRSELERVDEFSRVSLGHAGVELLERQDPGAAASALIGDVLVARDRRTFPVARAALACDLADDLIAQGALVEIDGVLSASDDLVEGVCLRSPTDPTQPSSF